MRIDSDKKFFILLMIMGVCLIPIFLIYNTHRKNINVDVKSVASTILENYDRTKLIHDEKDKIYADINVDKNMIEEYEYYYPIDSMLVEGLVVIKARKREDISYIENCINKYLDNQKSKFISYGVDQYAILNDANIYKRGQYIILAVNKNIGVINKIVREVFK